MEEGGVGGGLNKGGGMGGDLRTRKMSLKGFVFLFFN